MAALLMTDFQLERKHEIRFGCVFKMIGDAVFEA
jgi:hypothetical protein